MGSAELPLDFDAWAELSARMLKRDAEERRAILEARGVEPDVWQRCEEHHSKLLSQSVLDEEDDLGKRYGAAWAAELKRRKTSPAEPIAKAPEPEPVAGPETEPTPAVPVQEVVPSFLRESEIRPAPVLAPRRFDGTMEVSAAVLLANAAPLPFTDKPSPGMTAVPAAVPSAPSPDRAEHSGSTLPLGIDLHAHVKAALPFPAPSIEHAATFPRLTLQAYASLCAELSVHPERTLEILRKYNVKDEPQRQALEHDWHARLAAHADTEAQWRGLVATYREWLLQQARRR